MTPNVTVGVVYRVEAHAGVGFIRFLGECLQINDNDIVFLTALNGQIRRVRVANWDLIALERTPR